MKLFLVFLFFASCQAIELFATSSYEAVKEVELKNLVNVTQEEMFKMLKKEYPNEDTEMLREIAHQLAIFIKDEIDSSLASFEKESKLASKLVDNMLKNLIKAKTDVVAGVESVPFSAITFLEDLTRDMDELKEHNEMTPYWENHFEHISEVLAYKLEYDIWDKLNDTLHRVVGHLSGKFSDLKDFFHKTIKVGAEKLQPHLINIKKLAKDVLAHVGSLSKNVAQQAIEFFKPFAKQLGGLWTILLDKIHTRIHAISHTETY